LRIDPFEIERDVDTVNGDRHIAVKRSTKFAALSEEEARARDQEGGAIKASGDGIEFEGKAGDGEGVDDVMAGDQQTNDIIDGQNQIVYHQLPMQRQEPR
jgi:hypothetical protein